MMKNKKVSLGKLSCFPRVSRKKGISAIVATVLIILITVAAVTIIWAAIIPMISNQLESGTTCLDAVSQVQILDQGYTCRNDTTGADRVSLQIKHGAKSFELADIQVLLSSGGTTTSYDLTNPATTKIPASMDATKLPGSNEERVYVISTTGITGDVDSVSIAPVVAVGNTQETCEVSATKVLLPC
jgi:flagellin-like protein